MIINQTLDEFTKNIFSDSPVPGGGGASAMMGAIGISLGGMVGSLTVGKPKYADVEDDIKALMEQAEELRLRFLELVDLDAEAFSPLSKAYGIPKDDPTRAEVMEDALRHAASVPMEIMRACDRALDIIDQFESKGSRLVVSDARCGAICCKAAMEAASINVFVNTKLMTDREYADKIDQEAYRLLDRRNNG